MEEPQYPNIKSDSQNEKSRSMCCNGHKTKKIFQVTKEHFSGCSHVLLFVLVFV